MTTPYPNPNTPPGGPSFGTPYPGQAPPAGGYPPAQGSLPPGGGWGGAPAGAGVPGAMPPGWYPGPAGAQQWCDGRTWGPSAAPQNDNSGTMALFCYLGMFLGGFLVPLIILLVEGKKNRFVKHHATEALNWSVTMYVALVPTMIAYFVAFFAAFGGFATGTGGGAAAGVGIAVVVFILVIAVFVALSIASLVFTIIGAVKAGQRRWWRYPFAIRFIKGAASKEEVAALNSGVV